MSEKSNKELAVELVSKYLEANPAMQQPNSGKPIAQIKFDAVLKMVQLTHQTLKELD